MFSYLISHKSIAYIISYKIIMFIVVFYTFGYWCIVDMLFTCISL